MLTAGEKSTPYNCNRELGNPELHLSSDMSTHAQTRWPTTTSGTVTDPTDRRAEDWTVALRRRRAYGKNI